MKRFFGFIMSIVVVLTMAFSTPVFAAENSTTDVRPKVDSVANGAISGYGSVWHNASDSTTGDFLTYNIYLRVASIV